MIDATEVMGTAMRARPTLHSSAAAKDGDDNEASDDDGVAGPTDPTAPALAPDAVTDVLRALIA
jgi:hypothetical protein